MAMRSTYLCQECSNRFDATRGDLMKAKEFRCVSCDSVKYIPHAELETFDYKCADCGDKMDVIKIPMCPVCKKRNNKAEKLLMMID